MRYKLLASLAAATTSTSGHALQQASAQTGPARPAAHRAAATIARATTAQADGGSTRRGTRRKGGVMRRLSFIGVCLTPVLLLLGAVGTAAAASTSVPVTIQSTVMIGPHTGTWSVSGGISDSGTLVDVSDHLVGNGQIHVVRDVTGSLGTFTLRIDGSVTGVQPDGSVDFTDHWVVIAGTGGYVELRGQGTGSAVLARGVVTETLTGSVHFD
jgi:hypothetical protein